MNNIEKKIIKFFEDQPELIAVYLYGSMVTGRMNSESDIDIGILYHRDEIPSTSDLLELQTNLGDLLGRDVDLVCLNEVSPILQKQVISKGKRIVVNDQHQLNHFVIKAFTDYVDIKIVREPLEKYFATRRILNG